MSVAPIDSEAINARLAQVDHELVHLFLANHAPYHALWTQQGASPQWDQIIRTQLTTDLDIFCKSQAAQKQSVCDDCRQMAFAASFYTGITYGTFSVCACGRKYMTNAQTRMWAHAIDTLVRHRDSIQMCVYYENQRWSGPFSKVWRPCRDILSTDRPSWSDETGRLEMSSDSFLGLPMNDWLDEWHVRVLTQAPQAASQLLTDKNGWSYARDFKLGGWHAENASMDCVRRRAWIRKRLVTAPSDESIEVREAKKYMCSRYANAYQWYAQQRGIQGLVQRLKSDIRAVVMSLEQRGTLACDRCELVMFASIHTSSATSAYQSLVSSDTERVISCPRCASNHHLTTTAAVEEEKHLRALFGVTEPSCLAERFITWEREHSSTSVRPQPMRFNATKAYTTISGVHTLGEIGSVGVIVQQKQRSNPFIMIAIEPENDRMMVVFPSKAQWEAMVLPSTTSLLESYPVYALPIVATHHTYAWPGLPAPTFYHQVGTMHFDSVRHLVEVIGAHPCHAHHVQDEEVSNLSDDHVDAMYEQRQQEEKEGAQDGSGSEQ